MDQAVKRILVVSDLELGQDWRRVHRVLKQQVEHERTLRLCTVLQWLSWARAQTVEFAVDVSKGEFWLASDLAIPGRAYPLGEMNGATDLLRRGTCYERTGTDDRLAGRRYLPSREFPLMEELRRI